MVLSVELSEVLAPALVAGVMVALVHAPLGIEVLRRGIIFIDLAAPILSVVARSAAPVPVVVEIVTEGKSV